MVEAKPTVADLSNQLTSLMNKSAVEGIEDVPVPSKKVTKVAGFKGNLIAFDGLCVIPIRGYVAINVDKIERNQLHGMIPVLAEDGKTPLMEADGFEEDGITVHMAPKMRLCGCQLKQGKMTCPTCNVPADKESIVKGVETTKNTFILLSDEEMATMKPAMGDKTMKLTEFVDPTEISMTYVESSEYIVPEEGMEEPYLALVGALKLQDKFGRGVRIKGGREQAFILRPEGAVLMSHYLFAEYEVRECDKIPQGTANPELVQVMAGLIEAKTVKFTPAAVDPYLQGVRKLIKAKTAGVTIAAVKQDAAPKATTDLMGSLKKALSKVVHVVSKTAPQQILLGSDEVMETCRRTLSGL